MKRSVDDRGINSAEAEVDAGEGKVGQELVNDLRSSSTGGVRGG